MVQIALGRELFYWLLQVLILDTIHIPEGIHYECTGCGNCCLAWPVPITFDDYLRISKLNEKEIHPASISSGLFRALNSPELKLKGFSHTLEKRADGKCEFLTEDNCCQLHLNFGSQMKPYMCQLFPYTFNKTPSGVYVSLSFASTGALLNSGRALNQQSDLIRQKWELFCKLFPQVSPDWSQSQLVDGTYVDWDEFMLFDEVILRMIQPTGDGQIERRLLAISDYIVSKLSEGSLSQRLPAMAARPKLIDQIVLKHLFALYFPKDVFADNGVDLDKKALLKELVEPPQAVRLSYGGTSFGFQKLKDLVLSALDRESEDLLFRFVYCRLFAKLYFGGGFAHLSVLAGLHHLAILVALVRLKIKMSVLANEGLRPSFLEVVEMVRALERRLSQVCFSKETMTVLEVLLMSPERLERIL